MLAYQVLSDNKISSPRVIDYVSGSSLPCAIVYDGNENIYAFYQSYDGKFLQLGYKKYTSAQKHWSEFMPITKYAGNCEYPHAVIDENGIIHLCYQRRAPKFFELVYQQKEPDKNLWTSEVLVHSSVHSFENASILIDDGKIILYWVRDDIIYYNDSPRTGSGWGRPARHNFPSGGPLRCFGFKSNSPADRKADMPDSPPVILPGNLSNGLKLAFIGTGGPGGPSPAAAGNEPAGMPGGDIRKLVIDTFRQIQGSVEELKEGLASAGDDIAKLNNAYDQLSKELSKYAIRMNILENRISRAKRTDSIHGGKSDIVGVDIKGTKAVVNPERKIKAGSNPVKADAEGAESPPSSGRAETERAETRQKEAEYAGTAEQETVQPGTGPAERESAEHESAEREPAEREPTVHEPAVHEPTERELPEKSAETPDQQKLKEWQEWKEPEEWRGM